MLDYLAKNHQGAMTKSDLKEYLAVTDQGGLPQNRVLKRWGRDKNDIYWMLGKVHGLENIAKLSDEDLNKWNGDPIVLQEMLNKIENTGY